MGGRMLSLSLEGVTCNMEVSRLIEILRENRTKHIDVHERALAGWRKRVSQEIETLRTKLTSGDLNMSVSISLPRPESYTDAYDTVIRMLEDTTDETIRLESAAYRQLVQDQWEWSTGFITTSRAYGAGA